MSKAYVGFSTPVGYDYLNTAETVPSDVSSSPNPILVGVTGIIALFDEIWFPCRSICPQSMRNLDYVRFVAEEFPNLELDDERAHAIAEEHRQTFSLNDIHVGGYSAFMEKYYGFGHPDNHTHAVNCFGSMLGGNPTLLNIIRDVMVIDQLDINFTPVMNGLTRQMTFPDDYGWLRSDREDKAIRVADRILTISSLYDITGVSGPYHPVLKELRDHNFVASFRNWIRNESNSLHNRSAEQIISELNDVLREFERDALRKAVGKSSLRDVSVNLMEGVVLDAVPGAWTMKTAIDLIDRGNKLERLKMGAYIAESRGAMWDAHQGARTHIY